MSVPRDGQGEVKAVAFMRHHAMCVARMCVLCGCVGDSWVSVCAPLDHWLAREAPVCDHMRVLRGSRHVYPEAGPVMRWM